VAGADLRHVGTSSLSYRHPINRRCALAAEMEHQPAHSQSKKRQITRSDGWRSVRIQSEAGCSSSFMAIGAWSRLVLPLVRFAVLRIASPTTAVHDRPQSANNTSPSSGLACSFRNPFLSTRQVLAHTIHTVATRVLSLCIRTDNKKAVFCCPRWLIPRTGQRHEKTAFSCCQPRQRHKYKQAAFVRQVT
jgi:hypothetical protein